MTYTSGSIVLANVFVLFPEQGIIRDIPVRFSLTQVSDTSIEQALTEAVTATGSAQDEWQLTYDRNGEPLYYVNQYR